MFIGHFAVGLAARKAAPKTSLGTLVFAAQWLDLLWPVLLLAGLEKVRIDPGNTALTPLDFVSYPLSHSLVAAIGWALLIGIVYFAIRRNGRGAAVLGVAVISHWVLDFLTHRPDLPLIPGSPLRVGLGLWNHPIAAVTLEVGLFLGGAVIYQRVTRPVDRLGTIAFGAFIGFLLLVFVGNLVGPPPPSVEPIAWVALAQWLLVAWAAWIDRHRELVVPVSAGKPHQLSRSASALSSKR